MKNRIFYKYFVFKIKFVTFSDFEKSLSSDEKNILLTKFLIRYWVRRKKYWTGLKVKFPHIQLNLHTNIGKYLVCIKEADRK